MNIIPSHNNVISKYYCVITRILKRYSFGQRKITR